MKNVYNEHYCDECKHFEKSRNPESYTCKLYKEKLKWFQYACTHGFKPRNDD